MIQTLQALIDLMKSHGAVRVYAKKLAPNDNSKNQVYLGNDFSALNIIPHGTILNDSEIKAGSKHDRAKAKVQFYWIGLDGMHYAPDAQLILYPKYPEVRMSGFLNGCKNAPSCVMRSRQEGRALFFGIKNTGEVIGYAADIDDPVTRELHDKVDLKSIGIFLEIPIDQAAKSSKSQLLAALRKIYEKQWIASQKMLRDGKVKPYSARNGGGYTLEAELNIAPNGYSEPDFLGWEIKQYGVKDFIRFSARSPVTVFTPEPTGGIYKDFGIKHFMDQFAYSDKSGKTDRRNFGGKYTCTADYHKDTGLRLILTGYDASMGNTFDIGGAINLVDRDGEVAAKWEFSSILEHWNRKHAKAAYIPSLFRAPPPEYCYGPKILLCEHTDFIYFLKAMANSTIYYDPAIKVERASSDNPRIHRRSQFRISHKHLPEIYLRHEFLTL